jgi:hypothetical protein
MGMFARIMMGLAEQAPDNMTISIDATYLEAHRTASSLGLKKVRGRLIGQTKGGMNSEMIKEITNIFGALLFIDPDKLSLTMAVN